MTLDEFERAWFDFVVRWTKAGRRGPERQAALVAEALASGLSPRPEESDRSEMPRPAAMLRCHMAVVRASGVFDRRSYAKANPVTRNKKINPLEHYCREGWMGLRNPSRDFDVWWYWSEYLDPRHARVDPLLHYALVGRRAGNEAVPPVEQRSHHAAYEVGVSPRRVCLFAAYDPDGVVDDYVVDYVRELSRHADVYYLADGYMEPEELAKLDGLAKGAWGDAHGAYDFGSYAALAGELVGWDVIDQYDELLLVNDSAFLLRPLDDVFQEMDARTCDWWGLQATRHDFDRESNGGRPLPLAEAKATMVGERFMSDLDHLHISSYFLVFRRPVLDDPGFRRRLTSVCPQDEKVLVIYKYEIGISRYLMCRGLEVDTFIRDLYPFHPLYTEQYFELLEQGFPLLKRNFLSENTREVPDLVDWKQRVQAVVPEAPVDVFERNLHRVAPDDRLRRSFAIVSDEDGFVDIPRSLGYWELVDEDRVTPTYDHWWAFPVDVETGLLTSDQRAVLEVVREDPTIRKTILTRSRRVEIEGDNLRTVPLLSRDGQEEALRCRNFFLAQTPRAGVPYPLSPRRHRFTLVSGGGRIDVPRELAAANAETRDDAARLSQAVASSKVDALAVATVLSPLSFRDVFVGGAPRTDLILREESALAPDLRCQLDRLRQRLAGRPLVLLEIGGPLTDGGAGAFAAAELLSLAEWVDGHGHALGFRDSHHDRSRTLSRLLRDTSAVRLDRREFPFVEILYREAVALIGDSPGCAIDFAVTGRPAVTRIGGQPGLGRALHDLELVLPGAMVTDPASTREAVSDVLRSDGHARASRRPHLQLHAYSDGLNAVRLARRVRELDAGMTA